MIIRNLGCPASIADTVAAFCPLRSLNAAGNNPRLLGDYWFFAGRRGGNVVYVAGAGGLACGANLA